MATSSERPDTMDVSTPTGFWTPMKITVLAIGLVVLVVVGYGAWTVISPLVFHTGPLHPHW